MIQSLEQTAGDEQEQIFQAHLHLVNQTIAKLHNRSRGNLILADLESAGRIALFKATQDYLPNDQFPFEAHARLRVKSAVIDEWRKQHPSGRGVRKRAAELKKITEKLSQRLRREPSPAEIRKEMGMKREEFGRWLDSAKLVRLVDMDVKMESGMSLHDVISDTDDLSGFDRAARLDMLEHLREKIGVLRPKQRELIQLHYVEGLDYQAIAERFGVTPSAICVMHRNAVKRLREEFARFS